MKKIERDKAIEKVKSLYASYRLCEKWQSEIKNYEDTLKYVIKEQQRMKNVEVDPEEGYETSYEAKVQTSRNTTSRVEQRMVKYADDLEQKEIYCREMILERLCKISDIKAEFEGMKFNIDSLEPWYRQIIEIVCKEKGKKQIGYLVNSMFNGNSSTAYSHLDKALNLVMEFESNWRV